MNEFELVLNQFEHIIGWIAFIVVIACFVKFTFFTNDGE